MIRTRRSWSQAQIDQIRQEIIHFIQSGVTAEVAMQVVGDKWRLSKGGVQSIYYGVGCYEKFGKRKMVRISAPHPTQRKLPAGYRVRTTTNLIKRLSASGVVKNREEVNATELKAMVTMLKKTYGITSITF